MHKLHPLRESFETRFWKHVLKTKSCWLWTGFLDKHRRGQLRRGRATEGHVQAPIASWIIHHGEPNGMFVLHTCDNPQCVNPDHLYLGTQAQNIRDMVARNRHWLMGKGHLVKGEKNAHARLTWKIVSEIRSRHAAGEVGSALAREFGVTKENIYNIIHNRNWVV